MDGIPRKHGSRVGLESGCPRAVLGGLGLGEHLVAAEESCSTAVRAAATGTLGAAHSPAGTTAVWKVRISVVMSE